MSQLKIPRGANQLSYKVLGLAPKNITEITLVLVDFKNGFVVPGSNLIYRPLNILAGASTWQNLTAWLERGQKLMHYTAVLGLLLRMPYRNSELQMRMIRFDYISGYIYSIN